MITWKKIKGKKTCLRVAIGQFLNQTTRRPSSTSGNISRAQIIQRDIYNSPRPISMLFTVSNEVVLPSWNEWSRDLELGCHLYVKLIKSFNNIDTYYK